MPIKTLSTTNINFSGSDSHVDRNRQKPIIIPTKGSQNHRRDNSLKFLTSLYPPKRSHNPSPNTSRFEELSLGRKKPEIYENQVSNRTRRNWHKSMVKSSESSMMFTQNNQFNVKHIKQTDLNSNLYKTSYLLTFKRKRHQIGILNKKPDGRLNKAILRIDKSMGFNAHSLFDNVDDVNLDKGDQNHKSERDRLNASKLPIQEKMVRKLVLRRPAAPGRAALFKFKTVKVRSDNTTGNSSNSNNLLKVDMSAPEGHEGLKRIDIPNLKHEWSKNLKNEWMKSISIKFEDIDGYDPVFVKQTMPQMIKLISIEGNPTSFLKRLSLAKIDIGDIEDNINEVEYLMMSKSIANQCLPIENRIEVISKLVTNWIDVKNDHSIENMKKLSKAAIHLFNMVDENLNDEGRKENPDFLPHFFEVCNKIIVKGIEIEDQLEDSQKSEIAKKNLSIVCLALNQLINSVKSALFRIDRGHRSSILNGYLHNLFLVFYDLTEIKSDGWQSRLSNIGYSVLNIPQNLDSFFSHNDTVNYLADKEDFFDFFNRFYTCCLTLIIKSEFFQTSNLVIWKFILDLFSLHFIFNKTMRINGLCRRVMSTLTTRVSQENILLRYTALVSNIPTGHLVFDEIRISLQFNYIQINKVYQNSALYLNRWVPGLHKAIIKKAFIGLFKLIEQHLSALDTQKEVITLNVCWMKIFASYIHYSLHYGDPATVGLTFNNFKAAFQEILLRCRSMKVGRSNTELMSEMKRLVLHACDGINSYRSLKHRV